jgi:hypothetical protein
VAKAKSKKRVPYLSHGSEGLVEYGKRRVDDPLEPTAKMEVTVNVRESSIDHMASRGRINPSQADAGHLFRKLWELAAVGRSQGIDPAKEYVDGGDVGDPISDRLVKATRELNRILNVVGPVGAQFLIEIVGEGKRIEDVAAKWSKAGGVVTGRRAEGYAVARMIEALDQIVRYRKMESSPIIQDRKQHYRRNGALIPVKDDIRSSSEGHTGPVTELSTGKFGDTVKTVKRGIDRGPMTPHIAGNR